VGLRFLVVSIQKIENSDQIVGTGRAWPLPMTTSRCATEVPNQQRPIIQKEGNRSFPQLGFQEASSKNYF